MVSILLILIRIVHYVPLQEHLCGLVDTFTQFEHGLIANHYIAALVEDATKPDPQCSRVVGYGVRV